MGGSSYLYKYFHLSIHDNGNGHITHTERRSNCFSVNVSFQLLCEECEIQSHWSNDLKFISMIFDSTYGYFFEGRKRLFSHDLEAQLKAAQTASADPRLKSLYERFLAAARINHAEEIGAFLVHFQELYMALLLVWGGMPVSLFDKDVVLTTTRTKLFGTAHDEQRQNLLLELDLSQFELLTTMSTRQSTTLAFWILQFIEKVGTLLFVMEIDCSTPSRDRKNLVVDFCNRDNDYLASVALNESVTGLADVFACVKKHNGRAWEFIRKTLAEIRKSVSAGMHIASLPSVYEKLQAVFFAVRAVEDNEMLVRSYDYASVHNGADDSHMPNEKRRHRLVYSFFLDMQQRRSSVSLLFSFTYEVRKMVMHTVLHGEKKYVEIEGGACTILLDNADLGSEIPIQRLELKSISQEAHRAAAAALQLYTLQATFRQISEDALVEICRCLAQCESRKKGDGAICALLHSFRRLDDGDDVPKNHARIKRIVRDLDLFYKVNTSEIGPSTPELLAIHTAGLKLAKLIKNQPLHTLVKDISASGAVRKTAAAGAARRSKVAEARGRPNKCTPAWVPDTVHISSAGTINLPGATLSPCDFLIRMDSASFSAPIFGPMEEAAINKSVEKLLAAHILYASDPTFEQGGYHTVETERNLMTIRLKTSSSGFIISFFSQPNITFVSSHGLWYLPLNHVWNETNAPSLDIEVQTSPR